MLKAFRLELPDNIIRLQNLSTTKVAKTVLRSLLGLLETMRPKQWTKNVFFVFPALVFSAKLFELDLLYRVIACCLLLILTSGSIYLINDLTDLEVDRLHPTKKFRPIAAGKLSVSVAKIAAFVLPLLVFFAAYNFDRKLTLLLIVYFLFQVVYSFHIKHIVLLDIIAVAAGFVMRLIAGGIVIDVSVSPWLYTSAGLLALFLVISKRRQELVTLGEQAEATRPVFRQYNLPLLDDMLRIVTTSTIITYTLYTVEAETMIKFGENLGLITVPIVIYGLFRYLHLIHVKEEGAAPDEVLLTDRPLQMTIMIAALAYLIILYVL